MEFFSEENPEVSSPPPPQKTFYRIKIQKAYLFLNWN